MIYIKKEEFYKILSESLMYRALSSFGVDNWSYYYDALDELFTESFPDEEFDWDKFVESYFDDFAECGIISQDM